VNRRSFLAGASRGATALAAGTLLARGGLRSAHAAGSDQIRLALIGCGGRGSGAVVNAMDADDGVALTAMADLYEDRLERSRAAIEGKYKERAVVAPENRFIGFDAFKRAIDTLRPNSGDVAMLTGYAGFRPQQLEYAVSKGVNVFMEKSFAADPPGVRRVLKAAEEADACRRRLQLEAGFRHSDPLF
jgi:predicted dehydrogenase